MADTTLSEVLVNITNTINELLPSVADSSSSSYVSTDPDGILAKYATIDVLTKNVVVDTLEQTVSGDGIFDILMDTATKHLRAQFDANRIREEDYAVAYVDIYKATLNAALEAWKIELEAEKTNLVLNQTKAQTILSLTQAIHEEEATKTQVQQTTLTTANIADTLSKTKNLTAATTHNFNKAAANQKVTTKLDVDESVLTPDLKLVAFSSPSEIGTGEL